MSKKLTQEEYLEKCKKVHTIEWDYSRLVYTNINNKVEIGCPKHGFFWQDAYSHSIGLGCKHCADEANSKRILLGKEEYVKRANEKHNSFFDYSKLEYNGMNSKGTVTCPIHGDIEMLLTNHLKRGCPDCNRNQKEEIIRKRNEDNFFKKVKEVHPKGYTYPRFIYINAHTKATITCDLHGDFEQIPNIHIRGGHCKKCANKNVSKPETEVQEFVKSLGYNIDANNRKIIRPLELDIYIPSINKAIEFNGDWWHYDEKNPQRKAEGYHEMKTQKCIEVGVELLHIRESDWKSKKENIKTEIKNFLKNNNK